MASNDFFECTTALTQFLLEYSDDDTENLHIYHVIDLTEFKESADYERYSPVYVTDTPHGYHFKTFVKKCGSDIFIISVESCSGKLDSDLTWPIEVELTVSALNESTDQSLNVGNSRFVLNKPEQGVRDCVTSLAIEVNIRHLNDFVIDNNLILKCKVKLTSSQTSSDFSQREITPMDSLSYVQHGKSNFKDHLATLLSHNQLVWESLKSNQFKDEITQLTQTLSDCTQDDTKIESIDCRIDDVDKRIGDVKDKFMEQQEMMVEWMNSVRKKKIKANDLKDRLQDQHVLKSKVQETADGKTSSLQSEKKSSICEVLQKPMRRNFILIGSSGSGKGATGNSILLKRAFETGPKKIDSSMLKVEHSSVTLSGAPINITVVISRGDFVDFKAFDFCPEGFDAVLDVFRYNHFFYNDGFNSTFATERRFLQTFHQSFLQEIMSTFGVLIVTGGDMYKFDHPYEQDDPNVKPANKQLRDLKTLCQERVLLFDNITNSEQIKHRQIENLLKSLPRTTESFTRDWYTEVVMKNLKKNLFEFHLPENLDKMLVITEDFSFLNSYGDFKQLKDWQRICNSLKKLSWSGDFKRERKVVVFGTACGAFLSALQNMRIHNLPKNTSESLCERDVAALLVIPSTGISSIQEDTLKELYELYVEKFSDKLILIVTDDGFLNLSGDQAQFIEWCKQQTGWFKEIYQACSRRTVLFDYQTDEVSIRIEQEALLLYFLNKVPCTRKQGSSHQKCLPKTPGERIITSQHPKTFAEDSFPEPYTLGSVELEDDFYFNPPPTKLFADYMRVPRYREKRSYRGLPSHTANIESSQQLKMPESSELLKLQESSELLKIQETSELLKMQESSEILKMQESSEILKIPDSSELLKIQETSELLKMQESSEILKIPDSSEILKILESSDPMKIPESSELLKIPETSKLFKKRKSFQQLTIPESLEKTQAIKKDSKLPTD